MPSFLNCLIAFILVSTSTAATCEWQGHCAGAQCKDNNDCSDILVCIDKVCTSPLKSVSSTRSKSASATKTSSKTSTVTRKTSSTPTSTLTKSSTKTTSTASRRSSSSKASSTKKTKVPSTRTKTSSSQKPAATSTLPSKVLDLKNWLLILPIVRSDGFALQVKQPKLATLSNKYFYADSSAVYFAPSYGGAKTPGSLYPRTELDQMSGSKLSSWSANSNTRHYLKFRGAVLKQPGNPPGGITIAQLFSKSVRFLASLHLNSNGMFVLKIQGKPDSFDPTVAIINYNLGDDYSVEMSTLKGVLTVSMTINGVTKSKTLSGLKQVDCRWKAGAYIQNLTSQVGLSSDSTEQVVVRITSIKAF